MFLPRWNGEAEVLVVDLAGGMAMWRAPVIISRFLYLFVVLTIFTMARVFCLTTCLKLHLSK